MSRRHDGITACDCTHHRFVIEHIAALDAKLVVPFDNLRGSPRDRRHLVARSGVRLGWAQRKEQESSQKPIRSTHRKATNHRR